MIPTYKIVIYDVYEDDSVRVADMLRDAADRIEESDADKRIECRLKRGHVTLEMQTV
jgi:hypothetical protein